LEGVRTRRFGGSCHGDLFVEIVKRLGLLVRGEYELVVELSTSEVEGDAIHSDWAPTLRRGLKENKMGFFARKLTS
jgi:hypothetical protein